jgi:hypothetical protein
MHNNQSEDREHNMLRNGYAITSLTMVGRLLLAELKPLSLLLATEVT